MNEEMQEHGKMPENNQPQISGNKLYPLDWNDTEVKLAKGRFSHFLARPTNELLLERQDELDTEIPIAKDGSYGLPDGIAQEEINAKYYERIKKNEATGYDGREIPTLHKSKAFEGLFLSDIYIEENCDIFDEEFTVIEDIGSGDEPDWTLTHRMTAPDEKDLKKIRQLFNNARLTPGKRGRQTFVQKANLRKVMIYFAQYYISTDGASVGGEKFSTERKAEFIAHINPLVQRGILRAIIEELTGKLLD